MVAEGREHGVDRMSYYGRVMVGGGDSYRVMV